MKTLVIDDYRTHWKFGSNTEVTYVRNVFDAYVLLTTEKWDAVWWDHDMGIENGDTTYPLACFIMMNPSLIKGNPEMYVHSWNPVGASNLVKTLTARWTTMRVNL